MSLPDAKSSSCQDLTAKTEDFQVNRRYKRRAEESPETSDAYFDSLFEKFSLKISEKIDSVQANLETSFSVKLLEATNNIKSEINSLQAQQAVFSSDLAEYKATLEFNSSEIDKHTQQIDLLTKNTQDCNFGKKSSRHETGTRRRSKRPKRFSTA